MKQSLILSVNNLNISIKSKGIVSHIVNDLSFNVERGEILSIVGENMDVTLVSSIDHLD